MRRAALLIGVSAALLLGACGGGGDNTGGTTGTGGSTTAAGGGPQGELGEDGIGSIKVGASTEDVEAAFGKPDQEREVPGCELAGPNAPQVLQWSWNLEDGAALLEFDVTDKQLISYRTTSTDLPTTSGVRVGDTYGTLRDSYGPTLRPLQIGTGPTEEAGLWYVGEQGKAWLLFTVAGGTVKTIEGGNVQICE